MHQREIVAGTPRIYGQLVQTLAPYTRVIKAEDETATADTPATTAATKAATSEAAAPRTRGPVRIKRNEAKDEGQDSPL